MTRIEESKHPRSSRRHFAPTCPPGYITEDELAKRLGKHPKTIEMWRAKAYCPPYVKLGFTIFYREDAVDQWLKSLEIDPAKPRAAVSDAG